jgi:hypothetical protein
LCRIYVLAPGDGIDYNLACIPLDFRPQRPSEFDAKYMNEEFTVACNLARPGYKWTSTRRVMNPTAKMKNLSLDGGSRFQEALA